LIDRPLESPLAKVTDVEDPKLVLLAAGTVAFGLFEGPEKTRL
jgi:hypothetical protein